MSKRGSSLIFVMLVVAGIVTVTLGTQRLALVQFSQSISDEDNLGAYYAAKAGIEDGLARFRFGRNADTIQSSNSNTTERYDVTNGQSLGYTADNTVITTAAGYNPNHQYYDLKIAYRSDSLQNVTIAQDDTLELTGFPDSSNDYYLRYQLNFPASQTGCFVTIQEVTQSTGGFQYQPQVVANQIGSQTTFDSAAQGSNLLIRTSSGGAHVATLVRLRPYAPGPGCTNGTVVASFSTVTGSNSITSAGVNFDSTQTIITATGYVGTTKRTLIATVDRRSGALLSIYDFNAFAGNGSIQP